MNKYFRVSLFIAAAGMGCVSSPAPQAVGEPIDSLNGVTVYYSQSPEGLPPEQADLAQHYTSLEFVKRYYAEVLGVTLPDSLRSAAAFFDPGIPDGEVNPATGLRQFTKPSMAPPRKNDIVVFSDAAYDPGGHLAIVADVSAKEIVIVQQNPGPLAKAREPLRYYLRRKKWYVQHPHVAGWLHLGE